jgi:hypothetical protein
LDVVVLDLTRLGHEGYLLANSIKGLSAWRTPLLIAFTGDANPEEDGHFSQEGVIDLRPSKPVADSKFRCLLKRFQCLLEDIEEFDPVI